MRSLQIVRFQGRESDEFATVQVRASAGQHVLTGPAKSQLYSSRVANSNPLK